MNEEWVVIPNFPRYEVSSESRFRNVDTGKILQVTPNQFGDLTIGFMRDGRQYRRSAKVIVARAFVLGEDYKFNTPILLDGNKNNIHHSNIVWRPRWLAWEYVRQFDNDRQPIWYFHGPLEDRAGNRYDTVFQCSTEIGSLCKDIVRSIREGTPVFPGGEIFHYVKKPKHI